MGNTCDPGGPMDLEPDETRRRLRHLTGVDAHPHADLLAARPFVGGKSKLGLDHG